MLVQQKALCAAEGSELRAVQELPAVLLLLLETLVVVVVLLLLIPCGHCTVPALQPNATAQQQQ